MPRRGSLPFAPTAVLPFVEPEGLRATLNRLHAAGPGAWRDDPEAAELMRFAADRYAALARKYGLEPTDAAVAAFEAMQSEAARTANDPWAVVTVAVRITLIAEHRAQGLLTSTERARRPEYSCFHDAERFSDRETELVEYHPAFQVVSEHDVEPDQLPRSRSAGTHQAVTDAVTLLTLLGWPADIAHAGVDYVTARLIDIGDRAAAYDVLRRDKSVRALLDLPHAPWIGLLRIVLGHPNAPTRNGRRGVLARLLIGDTLDDLLADDDLLRTAAASNRLQMVTADG
ncbi:hypothetical protein [Jiangella muralis]|uniref:hypothetical protein n=1 Tax=Jiangella muralis TaxID=702383 RepID=UPI00069EF567|nr:hypothetical protein [Jiangella muralis]